MISSKASIHPSAKIGKNTIIEAFASVGPGVHLGDDSFIGAFSHVYWGSVLGDRVYIGSHCHIGSDGFGYAQDKSGESTFTPQLGIVRIGDDCKILDHCCIDRAAFNETRIEASCVLGGSSHIAHNLIIGSGSNIGPGFVVAGSTTIGKQSKIGDRTNCVGHISLPEKFLCEPMSLINNSVNQSGHYAGTPLKSINDWQKIRSAIDQLPSTETEVLS